jgi:hypothetical protein
MDLIYTDARKIDQGVLSAYSLDLSFGEDQNENDFELTISNNDARLEDDAVIYFEDTEYGGIIDGLKTNSESETRTYIGRTWHGLLNNKVIQPDSGADYLIVSGDANAVLGTLIARLGLSGLFKADSEPSGITITNYQFARYCLAYDGIRAMLAEFDAKLMMRWENGSVRLYAEKIVNDADAALDNDVAQLIVERHGNKVNHLICLGRGELADRDVIHLYVDQFGRIGNVQYYIGLKEIAEVYDYSSAQSVDDLRINGIKHLKELRENDKVDVSVNDSSEIVYDIGDVITAHDVNSGNSGSAIVTQKIVKIQNGTVSINYKTGR